VGRGRILVSGEDAATRIAVNQALARAGYSARGTSDDATLWKWIREGDGDVLITDIIPPGEDAFDLVPRIKDIRPDLPVIVLTKQNDLLTAIKATERRAYEYFSKPFDIGKLITVVERALRKPANAYPPPNANCLDGDI
jgi:two-component system, NtrC family, nitrogen regulation response regulator GlnG